MRTCQLATHSTDAAYSAVVKVFQHVLAHSERGSEEGLYPRLIAVCIINSRHKKNTKKV